MIFLVLPKVTKASVFTVFANVNSKKNIEGVSEKTINSQNISILQPVRSVDREQFRGGGDITVIGGTALLAESGPVGTMADVEDFMTTETISTYVVRSGDTIQGIAKMFGVSVNTIVWSNDLKGSTIREGQILVILPISGVQHTVVKGDTIQSIAKKYKADQYDIARYNDLDLNQTLKVGDIVMVPDGELSSPATKTAITTNKLRGANGPLYEGYYLRPILNGYRSQGLHGYNGVDLATYSGAPIFASAEGDVIVAAKGGWNGGYGKYIVIAHPNGTQTLYGHALEVLVNVGDHVVRGQIIGKVGSTGKSTGPHVHFEIRGAKNPF